MGVSSKVVMHYPDNAEMGVTRRVAFVQESVLTSSAVVQWLGYLTFTQKTRVQFPAAESFCVNFGLLFDVTYYVNISHIMTTTITIT